MCASLWLACPTTANAATRYVWQESPSPAPPYTNWVTAAHVIQDAVDAAAPGDQVLVTNGVYATGGKAMGTNILVNRVAVDKPLSLLSVNGPEVTIIQGYQVPGTTNGDGAVRCVYLTNDVMLAGFTLTNGATVEFESGGGVSCESISALVTNCILTGNSAGGGGGGAFQGTLDRCTLVGNSAPGGGGSWGSKLDHCLVMNNSASELGGGVLGGDFHRELTGCVLVGNTAGLAGGGTYQSTLNNCTVTGNSALWDGGGVSESTLTNCIVYFNSAPSGANHIFSALHYSCTTPLPLEGGGNIATDPQLASSSHLSAGSPCRGAGVAAPATATDLDGEVWASPPSMGCDEYHVGAVTGPLGVGIAATFTTVATGYPVRLTALIEGRVTHSVWELGDGIIVTNLPCTSRSWAVPGDHAVLLRAYNESFPTGVTATVMVQVVTPPVHYVAASSSNPVSPYTSWATAATTIQDAVDAAGTLPGTLVLVSNGVYATGERTVDGVTTNRVVVDKPLALRSVNGPQLTVILGSKPPEIRCVHLISGASLSGFTLTNGATTGSGGGVWCGSVEAVVSNCILKGNSAFDYGGGAFGGTLNDCSLFQNSAASGAGARNCVLNNCTVTGNSSPYSGGGGGGASYSTLNNCIVMSNSVPGTYTVGGGVFVCTVVNSTLTANSAGAEGGGAHEATLINCVLINNSAQSGGGAYRSSLKSCTLTGNSATSIGGGVYESWLNNCIIYFNSAPFAANHYDLFAAPQYCCTIPLPFDGTGNITNPPLFVDTNGWSNLRLQSSSPCINAGNNAHVSGSRDLDGRPRLAGSTVDMGAYEFQGPGQSEFIGWLQQHALPTDGSADFTDADTDGHNNWQEWKAWTIPTDALSVLKLLTPQPDAGGTLISWQSVAGRSYVLERAANAGGGFTLLQSNLVGQAGTTSFTDTNGAGVNRFFYRVGVGN